MVELRYGWLALLAAPFVGSFLGVAARRLPAGRPVILGRSACEACGRVLRSWEMVPLLSFAWLRGRCAGCGAAIGWRVLAWELAAVAVVASVLAAGFAGPEILWVSGLGWGLLVLAAIDAGHWVLPDAVTLPLVALGMVRAWTAGPEAAVDAGLGAALGYTSLFLLAFFYRRWRGRDGLGLGDAKLLAVAGAWLGVSTLPWVVLGAAVTALVWLLGTAWWSGQRVGRTMAVPFGPFLCVAIWAAMLAAARPGE